MNTTTVYYERSIQDQLSFRGKPLLQGRHRIHSYPAMLHPLLVDHLIDRYAREGDVIFDPFCGSGVTLLQAKIKGYESIGFDINPVALLIARAKTQTYQQDKLLAEIQDLTRFLCDETFSTDIPDIKKIDYWYADDVANDLGRIRWLLKNRTYEYKDFFMAIFASICRNQSWTRNGEFKRFRVTRDKMSKTKNQVLTKFVEQAREMALIFSCHNYDPQSAPIFANSEKSIPSNIKYDLVITSPPYGDSRTTVAYGQYTSFGIEWLNGLNGSNKSGYQIDSECLGKRGILNKGLSKHEILSETIEQVKAADEKSKRYCDVLNFFNGYYNVVQNVVKNLRPRGRTCFVVGNRTVKGIQIPMDQITASFLAESGMDFHGIFVRDIHNKVMPSQNSPTNQVGAKSKTMSNEYIVVFTKP